MLEDEDLGLMTTSLAFIIFGNILDNSANHKRLIVYCDLLIGCLYILFSASILIHNHSTFKLEEGLFDTLVENIKLCLYVVGPCLYLMIWL